MGSTTTRHPHEVVWSVVLAAGSGQRFGSAKQFETLGTKRVVEWSFDVLHAHSAGVVLVVPDGHTDHNGHGVCVVGGATRSDSVRNALAAIPPEATIVCVHDAARPFVPETVIHAVIDAVADGADGAVPGLEVADTIKVVNADAVVVDTPDRGGLRAVQTPQAFRASVLRAAHASGANATDDAALVEAQGGRVVVVPGDPLLRKITTRDDYSWAQLVAHRHDEGEV